VLESETVRSGHKEVPSEEEIRMGYGIGIGIVLIVIGCILTFALQVDIPGIGDDTLGIILIVAGVVAIILGFVMAAMRGRSRQVTEVRGDRGTTVQETRRDDVV